MGRKNHLLSTTSEQSASLDIDLFKDYSKEVAPPVSRPRQNSAPTSDSVPRRASAPTEEKERNGRGGNLRNGEGEVISDAVVGHPEVQEEEEEEEMPCYQWMHQPEVLIKGCCNYTASVSVPYTRGNYFYM